VQLTRWPVEVGQSVVVGIPEIPCYKPSCLDVSLIPLLVNWRAVFTFGLGWRIQGIACYFFYYGFAGGLLLARNKSKQEINNLDLLPKILRKLNRLR